MVKNLFKKQLVFAFFLLQAATNLALASSMEQYPDQPSGSRERLPAQQRQPEQRGRDWLTLSNAWARDLSAGNHNQLRPECIEMYRDSRDPERKQAIANLLWYLPGVNKEQERENKEALYPLILESALDGSNSEYQWKALRRLWDAPLYPDTRERLVPALRHFADHPGAYQEMARGKLDVYTADLERSQDLAQLNQPRE